jgi:Holliday junction resolvasome RuvABC endonuclease subunit
METGSETGCMDPSKSKSKDVKKERHVKDKPVDVLTSPLRLDLDNSPLELGLDTSNTQEKQKEIIVLCLDPALCSGYCLIKLCFEKKMGKDGKKRKHFFGADIYEYGILRVENNQDNPGVVLMEYENKILELVDKHGVKDIGVEKYFFSKRFANGSTMNVYFRAIVALVAAKKNLGYKEIDISMWKAFVAGKSRPSKEQISKWGKEASKKVFIQQALWENYGFRFSDHCLSEKTGRPIRFKYDVSDVVGQAVYYCGCLLQIPKEKVTLSVKSEEDVFGDKNKGFRYPKDGKEKERVVVKKEKKVVVKKKGSKKVYR